jgi:sulfite reductase (NADPH) flavoprotein alpha-component
MSEESAPKPLYNNRNLFPSRHLENRKLTGEASAKDTRHHILCLAGSGMSYEPGDALALKVTNNPELVNLTLEALGATGDEPVTVKTETKSLREALTRDNIIHFTEKKFLTKLIEKDPVGTARIAEMLKPENKAALDDYLIARDGARDYVDILREFPSVKFTPQEFVDSTRALAIRLYSIASSLRAHPEQVHLTVATVRWESHGRKREGIASTFLADRYEGDTTAGVFIQPQKHFRMPEDTDRPIIMVGPGTGLAPFRAFMEEREVTGAKGKNWVFFGEQRSGSDFFYRDQFEKWQKSGVLSRLDLAWSRDNPANREFVQHKMKAAGAELWKWLADGAYFYVCGNKDRMAVDVHATLIDIAQTHGGKSPEEAKAFIEETMMKTEKRYRRDVY